MPITFNERFLAYLALFSGLVISVVAEYYSILGLTAIFAAAVIPVIIMGIALGVGKITATLWLKQNWSISPWSIRIYLATAIAVLMLITSMGIFGFLSKAHSDQSLVSGDVQSKIAVYDEKIKTAKENIDANRKALKQMDEAVDQVMGRSTDEKGAEKAVAIRRSQAKERARLLSDIAAEQKTIAQLSEDRAPIAADVRKVEAEVGPIKYVAELVYGESTTEMIDKAVRLMIILIIFVFDPLAILLLIAANMEIKKNAPRVIVEPAVIEKKEEATMESPSAATPRKPKKPIKPKKPVPSVPKKKPSKPKVPKKKPITKPKTPAKPKVPKKKPQRKMNIGSGEDVAQDDTITIRKSTVYRFDG